MIIIAVERLGKKKQIILKKTYRYTLKK